MSSKAPKRKASSTEAEVNNGKPCIDFQPGDRWQLKDDEESSDSQPSNMKSANGRSLRSRSSRNSAKKDAPAINGEAEEAGAQKDTSKAAANRTPSKKKAVDEAATKASEETSKKANDETSKSENGRASLKRKKSSAEESDDQKEKAPPSKTKKVSNSSKKVREEIKENDGENEESNSHEEDEVQEIDDENDSKNGEEEDDEVQEISEVVADKASPKEVIVESSESSQDSQKDSEGKVVDLDSSIEMLDDEDDDAESLDTPSSASEPKDEASKDGSSSETSKDKTVNEKSKNDDIEIINIKDDDGKKDEESDSECQIITEDEPSDTVKSDAQNFPCPTLSEKDVSLSAGYPYYNSLKEKITNFKAGDFKPVKFPHTGTLLLGENEVIIESPSLLVPLLIKEADEFPKPEGDDKKSDDDAIVIKPSMISRKNFFQSSVGQFLINLGTSRVQEWYHRDMKRAKLKQLKSNKPTEENLEKAVEFHDKRHDELKEINAIFSFRLRQCKFCSFKSESQSVMEQHYLTPHLSPRREYKCNFCDFLTRDPGTIVFHFEAMHGKKARLDANITFHECVFCSFQSHLKSKVNCHMNRCRKHFIPSQNLAPPFDFEFPGVTTKPVTIADVVGHRRMLMNSKNQQGMSGDNSAYARKKLASVLNRLSGGQSSYDVKNPNLMKQLMTGQSQLPGSSIQLPPGIVITRPRGGGPIQQIRPVGRFPVPRGAVPSSRPQYLAKPGRPPLNASITASQLSSAGISITPVTRPGGAPRTGNLPGVRNITLTPIGNTGNSLHPNAAGSSGLVGQPQTRMPLNIRPLRPVAPYQRLNTPPSQVVKGSSGNTFVVCEICDSYIKDLEELRTHMNWVHKVKIHPKMLVSRPPLNCQKCQWRFFTDQGLERHLLGAHGLVTTNMQEMANKSQDGGRCIICGAVFTYKLVSHMTTVHKVTLKPAHLSYKCTVCTATFTLYRLFESHVYNVHSNSAKRNAEAASEEPVTSEPPAKKPAVAQGPKKCRECNIITDNMDEHIIKNHMKKLSVPLCRIEKCKKCLYKSDEMLLIRMSDFGLEEDSSSGSEEGSSEEGSSEEEEEDEDEDGKDSG
ncbi:hypothetical protein JTE90_005056 [Oedothorax gibbosus]|uniref:MOG interacting and ectopic P-granules protein 1 n=1 Tax=Oedothorax gibbosus TaxID=931172 RepID=A0AAV6VCQ6_9ARAC|nr:hypothetical protein JTE90_005056 [Oedothorax gibbosus]